MKAEVCEIGSLVYFTTASLSHHALQYERARPMPKTVYAKLRTTLRLKKETPLLGRPRINIETNVLQIVETAARKTAYNCIPFFLSKTIQEARKGIINLCQFYRARNAFISYLYICT